MTGKSDIRSYFEPESWRAFTADETLAHLKNMRTGRRKKKQSKKQSSRLTNLVLQRTISPFDAYTYLHARFGPPNGLQTFIAKDDSDNLFHWDYNLKAGNKNITFVGATEEVHVWFDANMSDAQCLHFINTLRVDFGRVRKLKGKFTQTLEKWNIFPNQYLTIANRCAELYHTVSSAVPRVQNKIISDLQISQNLSSDNHRKSHGKLMSAVTSASTELSVLIPVMFESFIGLIIAVFIRPEIKRDAVEFNSFVRSPLNLKLVRLAEKCKGFERSLTQNNPVFGRYWSVVNKRNDILHGNVDPVRHAVEVVYFHGKRPLYKSGGDRIRQHWVRLLDQYKPQEVLDDYIAMHEFIIEILGHLKPAYRRTIWLLMEDSQPGWDNKRKMIGRLFPDLISSSFFDGLRYDWQLDDTPTN